MDLFTFASILFGIYLAVDLLLGIGLTTRVILQYGKKPSPLMRMCGAAMLGDAATQIIRQIFFFYYPSTFNTYLGNVLNGSDEILIFLAAETLVFGTYPSKRTCWLATIPYLLIFILLFVFHDHLGHWIYWGIFAISLFICLHIYARLINYHKKLKNRLSNIEGYTAHWLAFFATAIPLELIFWINAITTTRHLLEWECICAVFLIIVWLMLFYFAVAQKMLDPDEQESEGTGGPDTTESSDTASTYGISINRLETLLTDERIYLRPDLNVETMVQLLNTNRFAFSNYIHNTLNTNFYDFINTYRINEAKHFLKNTELKIEDVALQCGFNSSRAFLRVFKNATGKTPREWRKEEV